MIAAYGSLMVVLVGEPAESAAPASPAATAAVEPATSAEPAAAVTPATPAPEPAAPVVPATPATAPAPPIAPAPAAAPAAPAPHVAEDGRKSDRLHLQLDVDPTWGIGGQMFLGTQLRLAALLEHWTTRRALGTWDFGVNFAYQNEPLFLLILVDTSGQRGANHRTQLAASVGHTAHMGKRRRVALGLHVFGGWNAWRSDYSVDYPDEDVHGSAVVVRHRPIVGAELRFAYRFHRRVGINVMLSAPFPTASSYLITFGQLGVGLAFYLR
jgi:hypothetical protein